MKRDGSRTGAARPYRDEQSGRDQKLNGLFTVEGPLAAGNFHVLIESVMHFARISTTREED